MPHLRTFCRRSRAPLRERRRTLTKSWSARSSLLGLQARIALAPVFGPLHSGLDLAGSLGRLPFGRTRFLALAGGRLAGGRLAVVGFLLGFRARAPRRTAVVRGRRGGLRRNHGVGGLSGRNRLTEGRRGQESNRQAATPPIKRVIMRKSP